jgi:prepilin-type N-terminal cleavage/methylation domain-containing protein
LKYGKGFTLIELLAVIVVLALVLIIAVPAIGRVIENSRRQAYLNDEKMMEKAAKTYVMKNLTLLPKEIGEKKPILLSDMVKANVIDEIKDPKDKDNNCLGYVEIEKVSDKKYNYKAYLKCGDNYATEGIVDGMLTTVPKVTDSNPGVLSGSGSGSDPYLIESIEDLVAFGQAVDGGNTYSGKYIRLEVDLDFDSINSYGGTDENAKQELKTSLMTGAGFNPIGHYSTGESIFYPFSGTFDGNNKVIKNLRINRLNDSQGLFASIYYGTIQNMSLLNVNIQTANLSGGLAGTIDESIISNVTVTGNITGNVYVGGLAGYLAGSTITNSYATGNVTGNEVVGGLVGYLSNDSTISNSYATGNITGNESVGGLVGYLVNGAVTNSYATGSVAGHINIGGLIGDASNATILNVYTTNNVTGNTYVGGLAGIWFGSTMNNAYVTGNVTGVDSDDYELWCIGRFIGVPIDETGLDNLYYYDSLTCINCDDEDILESLSGKLSPVNASNLGSSNWYKNTLGWNSQWSLTNGKYPLLYKKDTTTLLGGQALINTP